MVWLVYGHYWTLFTIYYILTPVTVSVTHKFPHQSWWWCDDNAGLSAPLSSGQSAEDGLLASWWCQHIWHQPVLTLRKTRGPSGMLYNTPELTRPFWSRPLVQNQSVKHYNFCLLMHCVYHWPVLCLINILPVWFISISSCGVYSQSDTSPTPHIVQHASPCRGFNLGKGGGFCL